MDVRSILRRNSSDNGQPKVDSLCFTLFQLYTKQVRENAAWMCTTVLQNTPIIYHHAGSRAVLASHTNLGNCQETCASLCTVFDWPHLPQPGCAAPTWLTPITDHRPHTCTTYRQAPRCPAQLSTSIPGMPHKLDVHPTGMCAYGSTCTHHHLPPTTSLPPPPPRLQKHNDCRATLPLHYQPSTKLATSLGSTPPSMLPVPSAICRRDPQQLPSSRFKQHIDWSNMKQYTVCWVRCMWMQASCHMVWLPIHVHWRFVRGMHTCTVQQEPLR